MMKRSALSVALLAASVTSLPALAQSAKDFELLRNEVLRLRKELDELKGQQAAKPAPAPAVVAAPQPAADTAALTERIEQVELKQKDAVVAGDIPGSFRLPGSDTSIKLYGYVEVNAVREFKGANGGNDYSTFLPYAPLNGSTARKGETYLHARTSRIGIETSTPTAYGPLGIKLEGDFNNDPRLGGSAVSGDVKAIYTQQATNSYNFRLRQAVATFAGFTVGQTWSTFMDVDNAPETVDFNGPIGSTFIRQPVVRYTYATPDLGGFTVAVENPVSYALAKTVDPDTGEISRGTTASGFSKSPDLVLRWDKGFDWGAASVRGVTQQVKVIDDAGINADKRGYGIAGTGLIKLRGGQDTLSVGLTYGDGVGRYFNYLEGAIVNTEANRILMERALGTVIGYQYKASDTLRANFVGGWQKNFNNAYTEYALTNGFGTGQYGINKRMYQLHAGLIYNPVKNVDLGAEYIWGERETLAGEKGSLSRFNLMARYTFN